MRKLRRRVAANLGLALAADLLLRHDLWIFVSDRKIAVSVQQLFMLMNILLAELITKQFAFISSGQLDKNS